MDTIAPLHFPALEFRQGASRRLFAFTAQGKDLDRFLTVSRVRRSDDALVLGYQRPEVLSHISEIRSYLESGEALLPNAIVVAFDRRVGFQSQDVVQPGTTRQGVLSIPAGGEDSEKPGWIVDGQQRMAALREAGLEDFAVCVIGFLAESEEEQREQFILVNSTKPLPKVLLYELLPVTDCRLPSFLAGRKFSAELMTRLNAEADSPFYSRVRMQTNPDGVVKDNSVLRMVENSLSDGVLYRFRSREENQHDVPRMMDVLKSYWRAVADVFPEAWQLPPNRSRLTHGAGIVSMGYVMDAIADRHRGEGIPTREQFASDLILLRETCRWTDGYWVFGPGAQRRWNEIQNTSKDIQLLTNYLMIQYKAMVWDREVTPAPRRGGPTRLRANLSA